MALAEIIKKILSEAEEKAGSILSGGEEEAQRIKKEAESKVREATEQIVSARRDSSSREARCITSLARLESKKAVLAARQKMLDRVFSDPKVRVKSAIEKKVVSFEGEKKELLEPEVYLKLRRPEYEARIAEILFKEVVSGADEK